MKRTFKRKVGYVLVILGALLSPILWADDLTVSGKLSVTGEADVYGNTLSLGTRSDTSVYPGWLTSYSDGTTSSVDFNATRGGNVWKWQQNAGVSLKLQMSLDDSNVLTLFDQSSPPNANIVLDPNGNSFFANSVTFNGTDNEMPNQLLIGPNSVLTVQIADQRYPSWEAISGAFVTQEYCEYNFLTWDDLFFAGYVTQDQMDQRYVPAGTVTSGGHAFGSSAFATGSNAVAIGDQASASGDESTAIGGYAMATGYVATSLGQGTASGDYSTVLGAGTASGMASTAMVNSTAAGDYSTAIGMSTANGQGSTAMGLYSTANGDYSVAMGYFTTAQSLASVALGQYNIGACATGGETSWISTDPIFEVGNGYVDPSTFHVVPSDALVVYKNGDAVFQGSVSVTPTGDIPSYTSN